ncbi:MAG: hypothetical protein HQL13_00480 [Candidatus Omnitrophica bacterium]|nr:hypothetical protein [Candidatus Omnitrophota bacterium]
MLPTVYLLEGVFIVLTLCSCVYIVFFLLFKNHPDILPETIVLPKTDVALNAMSFAPEFASVSGAQTRDIFSLPASTTTGNAALPPKGQLPGNLKVVGIVIASGAQVVIEDSSKNTTYFIDERHPQGGIKIVNVQKDKIIINYQEQDIALPVTKN